MTDKLFDALAEKADLFLKEQLRLFVEMHVSKRLALNDIINKTCSETAKIPETEDGIFKIWASVDDCLSELNHWSDFQQYPEFKAQSLSACRAYMEKLIAELPESQVETWDDLFYRDSTVNPLRARLFKRINLIKKGFQIRWIAVLNRVTQNQRKPAPYAHTLKTRLFADYYFQNPFARFMESMSDKMLGLASAQLDDLHKQLLEYIEGILLPEKKEEDWISETQDTFRERLLATAKELIVQEPWHESLNSFSSEVASLFEAWKAPLRKSFVHNSQYTGTWVLPHYSYGHRRIKKQERKQADLHKQNQKLWETHFDGEGKDWTHEFALNKRQVIVVQRITEAHTIISGKIQTQILPKCSDAVSILDTTRERLDSLETDQDRELKKNIVKESRALLRSFRHEMIPAIASRFLGAGIGQDLSRIITQATESADHLAESHTVFRHRDKTVPPHSEVAKIPIRDLFKEELLVKLKSVLDTFEHELRVRLDEIVNAMSEIRQSVEFNIETSLGLLEKEDYTDEAFQMVIDGIERSSGQLSELKKTVEAIPGTISSDLGKIAYQWVHHIQELLDNEKLIALKLALTKARASDRLKKAGLVIREWSSKLITNLVASTRKFHGRFLESYLQMRSRLGFAIPEDDIQVQFTQFLLETQKTLESLPFVYQQLFQREPLTDSRLFFGREADLKALTDEITLREKSGGSLLTALVGETGSGKTTLINMLEQAAPKKYPFTVISFSSTVHSAIEILSAFQVLSPESPMESMEHLESYLLSLSSPRIVVVENIHNFFVKNMDGFDHLEFLLALMQRTSQQVLWICSCAQYSWDYLDKSIRISKAFNRVITLNPFTGDQIESMILARHRMTGYQLKFKVSNKTALSGKYRKLSSENDRNAYLKKNFFEQIQKIASGNVSVAILFWLRSIEAIREHELQLASQVDFNVKFLSSLTPEDLFTLGAVAQHESLSVADHALIFRQQPRRSFLVLNALAGMGILQQTEDYYYIHPFLYRQVIRSLKLQNILH